MSKQTATYDTKLKEKSEIDSLTSFTFFCLFVCAQGTQIQATMFNEAAKKLYPMFELGKVYYISKGSLKIANKQYKTVQNDYELTLNEGACVEEAEGETFIPQVHYNFVKIDQLDSYVNGRELVGKSVRIIEIQFWTFCAYSWNTKIRVSI